MKKRIYISGPMTGIVDNNEQAFNEAEKELVDMGFLVVNPVRNGLPKTATWKEHMIKDIELLFNCDSIYFLKGFYGSKGARIERNIAMEQGYEFFFEEEENKSNIKYYSQKR